MTDLLDRIRTRLVPALLTAIGVVFLAGGLMSFTNPVDAGLFASSSPSPTEVAWAGSTPSPRITLPPLASGGFPTASPAVPADRVATRVRIAVLKIDLPVIKPGGSTQHPMCDVAMYFQDDRLGQPGQGRATYLYAHAQKGMFLPILTASKVSNGARMKRMVVEVWTSDDQRFLYVITQVLRHVPVGDAFVAPFAVTTEQLWLQTSEGVGTQPKLQIVAEPLSQEPAPHAAAHPVAKPRVC